MGAVGGNNGSVLEYGGGAVSGGGKVVGGRGARLCSGVPRTTVYIVRDEAGGALPPFILLLDGRSGSFSVRAALSRASMVSIVSIVLLLPRRPRDMVGVCSGYSYTDESKHDGMYFELGPNALLYHVSARAYGFEIFIGDVGDWIGDLIILLPMLVDTIILELVRRSEKLTNN